MESLKNNLQASIDAKQELIENKFLLSLFSQSVNLVLDSYSRGGRLYIAGNGGSAADAQHLAAEFVSKLAHDRAPLPAEALTTDSSILTAIGNDYGFEHVFSRQLIAKLKVNDIFWELLLLVVLQIY
jgi:D-sedoheptulose 7-phosphate isomerase